MDKIYQQKEQGRKYKCSASLKIKEMKIKRTMKWFLTYQTGKTQSLKMSSVNKCNLRKYVLVRV